jgi:hypothetical protein
MERSGIDNGTPLESPVPVALSIFRIRVNRLASILSLSNLATGTYLHRYPPHLFSCLAALAQAKDRPFQYLGTAFRVLKEIFCRIHLASLHQVTHGMFCHSAFLYHCFLVASLSTPPDFHLPFFNLHALKFLGVMCRTTLSKPRLTWPTGVNIIPRLLFGTYIHLQTTHNNAAHVDDTR